MRPWGLLPVATLWLAGCGGPSTPAHVWVRHGQMWTPGQGAAVRVVALNEAHAPMEGVRFRLGVVSGAGHDVLATGATDARGTWDGAFTAPEVEGEAQLVVELGAWTGRADVVLGAHGAFWMAALDGVTSQGQVPVTLVARDARTGVPWRRSVPLTRNGASEMAEPDARGRVHLELEPGTSVGCPFQVVDAAHPALNSVTPEGSGCLDPGEGGVTNKCEGAVYLDVWEGGELVRTTSLGPGEETTLPGEGRTLVEGWRLDEAGHPRLESRWLGAARSANPMQLEVHPESPLPGEPLAFSHMLAEESAFLWFWGGESPGQGARGTTERVGCQVAPGWVVPPATGQLGDVTWSPAPVPVTPLTLVAEGGSPLAFSIQPDDGGRAGATPEVAEGKGPATLVVGGLAWTGGRVVMEERTVAVQSLFRPGAAPGSLRVGDEVEWELARSTLGQVRLEGVRVEGAADGRMDGRVLKLHGVRPGRSLVHLALGREDRTWEYPHPIQVLDLEAPATPPPVAFLEQEDCPERAFHVESGGWRLYPGESPDVLTTAMALQKGGRCGLHARSDLAWLGDQQLSDGSFAPPGAHGRRLGRTDRDDRFLVTTEVARGLLSVGAQGDVLARCLDYLERELGFRRDPMALASALRALRDAGRDIQSPLARLQAWSDAPTPPTLLLPWSEDVQAAIQRLRGDAGALLGDGARIPPMDLASATAQQGGRNRLVVDWSRAPSRLGEEGILAVSGEVGEGLPAVVLDLPCVLEWDVRHLDPHLQETSVRAWKERDGTLSLHVGRGRFRFQLPVRARFVGRGRAGPPSLWDGARRVFLLQVGGPEVVVVDAGTPPGPGDGEAERQSQGL